MHPHFLRTTRARTQIDRRTAALWSQGLRSDIYKPHVQPTAAKDPLAQSGHRERAALKNVSNAAAAAQPPAEDGGADQKEREARRKERDAMLSKIKGDRARWMNSEHGASVCAIVDDDRTFLLEIIFFH